MKAIFPATVPVGVSLHPLRVNELSTNTADFPSVNSGFSGSLWPYLIKLETGIWIFYLLIQLPHFLIGNKLYYNWYILNTQEHNERWQYAEEPNTNPSHIIQWFYVSHEIKGTLGILNIKAKIDLWNWVCKAHYFTPTLCNSEMSWTCKWIHR